MEHCTFLIIAQLTGLLPDFPFGYKYNSQNGSYHLGIDLPIGQRDLSISKNQVLGRNGVFYIILLLWRRAKRDLYSVVLYPIISRSSLKEALLHPFFFLFPSMRIFASPYLTPSLFFLSFMLTLELYSPQADSRAISEADKSMHRASARRRGHGNRLIPNLPILDLHN